MPLPEINLSHYIRASIRLNESTAEQVDQYAAFVHASADDVVDKALNYVFSKGRDFQDFLKTTQAQHVAATLRVHRASSKDAPELPAKKLTAGVESGGFSAGGEAVIGRSIQCWDKNGAAHRKNYGHVTPNLGTAERSPAPKCLRASTRFGRAVLLSVRVFACGHGYVRKRKSTPACTWRKHIDTQAVLTLPQQGYWRTIWHEP